MSHRPKTTHPGSHFLSVTGASEHRSRQSGFTLLELVIYFTIVLIVSAPFVSIALVSARSTAENDTITRVEEQNRTALFRIEREIRKSLHGTAVISNGGSTLTVTSAAGFNGASVTAGPKISLTFRTSNGETLNGADDNGNGVVDEGEVARTDLSTGEVYVFVSAIDVPNSGFTLAGDGVSITVGSTASLDKKYGTFSVSNSLTVYPRN